MAYDPTASQGLTSDQIGLQVIDLSQRDAFFAQLTAEGWQMIGNPIQFPGSSDPNMLRYWAKEYAVTVNGEYVVEVNDPTFSTDPSNTLVYYIWVKRSAYDRTQVGAAPQAAFQSQQGYYGTATQQACSPAAATGQMNAPNYPNPIQVLEQLLGRLACILAEPTPRFQFQDTGELFHPFLLIRGHAYEHLGGRIMDLYLLKDSIHDYKIIGNESHGQTGGRLTPMRDEMFSIKTLGKASFFIMDEFKVLEQNQKNQIIYTLHLFLQPL